MKKIFLAFVAMACALSGCSDDDAESDNGLGGTIAISADTILAGTDGATEEITVTSSGDWRLAGVCDWAHPSAVSGRSGDKVTFTIDPNDTEDAREVTFKFFTGSAVAPLKVSSEPGYSLDLLSDADVTFEAPSVDLRIKLHTNIEDLDISFSDGGDQWITFADRSLAFGSTVFTFSVAENTAYDNRSTTITLAGKGKSVEIGVTQRQVDAIEIDSEIYEYDLAGRTVSIPVRSNIDYEVSFDAAWMKQISTRGLVEGTLRFQLEEATATRGVEVTLTGHGLTKKFTILQKDPDAKVFSIPDDRFREYLVENKWVMSVGGTMCVVLEAGLNGTEIYSTGSYYYGRIESLEGIENFPNVERITLNSNDLKVVDLSALTKVNYLSLNGNYYLEKVDLGDNPIESWNPVSNNYSSATSFTLISSRITTLQYYVTSWYGSYDRIEWIDVSECPALQTLNCTRGSSLTTLYLKSGQEIPNLTKNDSTEIVYKD